MTSKKRGAFSSEYVRDISPQAAKRFTRHKEESPAGHHRTDFYDNVSPDSDMRGTITGNLPRYGSGSYDKNYETQEMPYSNNDIKTSLQSSRSQSRPMLPVVSQQVSFIIITRDNNKPDPWGKQSTTTGKLTWPAVAEAYNKKFRAGQAPVGSAAMEKRARLHREAWMAARPKYPRKIVYAKRAPVSKTKPKPKSKPLRDTESKSMTFGISKSKSKAQSKTNSTGAKSGTILEQLRTYYAERSTRVGGWVPPDEIRNHAHEVSNADPDEEEHTTIDVLDLQGDYLGVTHVPTRDLVNTSALIARKRETIADIRLTLQCQSMTTVEMYAECISSERQMALPLLGIQQIRDHDGDIIEMASEQIGCDFAALVDLYNVATALEDSYVRQLVMNRWEEMIRSDIECELDPCALNNLFRGTGYADPAQTLWAHQLYFAGLAEAVISAGTYQPKLVAMLKELKAGGT
jgi:hypothetical protein